MSRSEAMEDEALPRMAGAPKDRPLSLDELRRSPEQIAHLTPEDHRLAVAACLALLVELNQVPPAAPTLANNGASGLLTAVQLADALHVHKSWVDSAARYDQIPCVRAGRYVRFSLAEVEAALRAKGREE